MKSSYLFSDLSVEMFLCRVQTLWKKFRHLRVSSLIFFTSSSHVFIQGIAHSAWNVQLAPIFMIKGSKVLVKNYVTLRTLILI